MRFGSRALVMKILQDMRASYWFWPSFLVLMAVVLSQLMEWVDRNPEFLPIQLPATLIDTQIDGARTTLSVIAQSVIGVTGVMFSTTMVAVSFAAGNFGPRLIGNFMRDRGNQISLGIMIATFVYTLLVLRSVQSPGPEGIEPFVPQYAMFVSLILALVSVFTMIYFVHHVPETINVSNITSALGRRFSSEIRRLIDKHAGDDGNAVDEPPDAQETKITLRGQGYIQQMDGDALIEYAQDGDFVVEVHQSPGKFVTPFETVMTVWSHDALTDEQIEDLQESFALGNSKTEAQNTTFIAAQLVEMLSRALSAGVNDPFTAINCLNWLYAGLLDALIYGDGLHTQAQGRVRIEHVRFEHLFSASFAAAAPYTVTDKMARLHHLRLAEALVDDAEGSDRTIIQTLIDQLKEAPTA